LQKGNYFFLSLEEFYFFPAYGLTETSPASHYDSAPSKVGTVGQLLPNTNGKVCHIVYGLICVRILIFMVLGKKNKTMGDNKYME